MGLWDSFMGLGNTLGGAFKSGGALYTGGGESPSVETRLDNGGDPAFAEKGSILGMTPSTFASMAGQAGAALTPKGSWQNQLGGVAAQMGSQKLAQLAQAEKEKRTTDLLKQLFAQAKAQDVNRVIDPANPMGQALSVGGVPKILGSGLSIDPKFQKQ